MITLREITIANFDECAGLKVKPEQSGFVASNSYSMAQSKYQPECIPLAVYNDETMVGFVMYCLEPELNEYCIFRVMTAAEHQGKGYGTAAMRLLMELISANKSHNKILISFHPENTEAEKLYAKLGFYRTGEMWDDEVVMRYDY